MTESEMYCEFDRTGKIGSFTLSKLIGRNHVCVISSIFKERSNLGHIKREDIQVVWLSSSLKPIKEYILTRDDVVKLFNGFCKLGDMAKEFKVRAGI